MSHLNKQFIEEMKVLLLERKAFLENDLAGLSSHTEVGEDYDENATEVQIDEVSRDLTVRMKADLEKIEAALARIDQGTYGVDNSGKEIAQERLRAIPWADTSI